MVVVAPLEGRVVIGFELVVGVQQVVAVGFDFGYFVYSFASGLVVVGLFGEPVGLVGVGWVVGVVGFVGVAFLGVVVAFVSLL